MAGKKLTQGDRERIAHAARAAYIAPRDESIERVCRKAHHDLYVSIIQMNFSPTFFDVAPTWLLADRSEFRLTVEPVRRSDDLVALGDKQEITLKLGLPVPWIPSSIYVPKTLKVSKVALECFNAANEEQASMNRQADKIRSEVRLALTNFSSVKMLVERWPEILPLVPRDILDGDPTRQLPAVPLERVNDLLNACGLITPT